MSSELFQQGIHQLQTGNYQGAKTLFAKDEQKQASTKLTIALLQQADHWLLEGCLQESAILYKKLLYRNPSLPAVHLGLARICLAAGQYDAALVYSTAATRLAPQAGLPWTLLGLVHENKADRQAALQYMKKGVENEPSSYLCQLNYGRILLVLGQEAQAIEPLRKAVSIRPQDPHALALLKIAINKISN